MPPRGASRTDGRPALLAHDPVQLALLTRAPPADNGGDVPWWVYPIGLPVLGVVIAIVRKMFKLDPTPSTAPPEGAHARPVTTDEKLDAAKELFLELRRDRDETKAELAATAKRHAAELESMRQRHDHELGEMQIRLRSQDVYIERLERLLGIGPAGPTTPFPQQ